MILKVKHFVLLLLIPFAVTIGAFLLSDGIAKWYFYSIAIINGVAIYCIIRQNPNSETAIFGEEPK